MSHYQQSPPGNEGQVFSDTVESDHMEILYVSKHCSKRVFEQLFNSLSLKPQQQGQKFHRTVAAGLAAQPNTTVTALTRLPLSRAHTKRMFLYSKPETEGDIRYIHLPHFNVPLGTILGAMCSFFVTVMWCVRKRKEQRVVVCDALGLSISFPAKLAGTLFGVKSLAIITDIPSQMRQYVNSPLVSSHKQRLYLVLSSYTLHRYNAYVVLTEAMNSLVNPHGRPHIVMEGLVEICGTESHPAVHRSDSETKVVMYAGALFEKYGVLALLHAFSLVSDTRAQLWICGAGCLESAVQEATQKDARIRYLGVIPNREVLAIQREATLLVNPRPSSEEFTKYSFPSKNMEYMASGTPVLTTKLPGMPEEYHRHVYLFDDESIPGMARKLTEVLSLPVVELQAKGRSAQEFVRDEKNNVAQTARIVKLIQESHQDWRA